MTRKTIVLIAAFVALGTATVGLVTAIVTQRGLILPLNILDLLSIKFTTSEMIDSWFGLAGHNKLISPSELGEPLKSFRNQWAKTNPTVTPFRLFWFLCGNEVYTDSFFFQNSPKSVTR